MKLEPHGKEEFEEGEYLWKYFDLHKFLHFISEKKLYFTRLDKFDDPLEGLSNKILGELSVYEQFDIKEEDLNPVIKERHLQSQKSRKTFVDNGTKESQTTQFANCWFLGKKESFAMWQLYSNKDSVVVRYKPKDLLTIVKAFAKSYIHDSFKIFSFGKVVYENIWPFNLFKTQVSSATISAFKKDSSYKHENEYRFVIITPKEKANEFSQFELFLGDISKDDVLVFANPHMEDWKFENIKRILEKFSPQIELKRSILRVKKV